MVRIGAIFIVLCMALIAGSLAFVLYFRFGLGAAKLGLVGLGALTALALYSGVSGRKQDRTEVSDQVANLARGADDLARQLGEFGRRLDIMETKLGTVLDKALATAQPLAAEIEELSRLVKELADSVAAHDATLARTGHGAADDQSPGDGAVALRPRADAAPAGRQCRQRTLSRSLPALSRAQSSRSCAAPSRPTGSISTCSRS